jgi:hypothetical protein
MREANRAIRTLVSRLAENSAEAGPANLSSSELKALSQKLAHVAKLLDRASPAQPKQQVPFTPFPRNLSSADAGGRESSSFRTEVAPRPSASSGQAFRRGDDEASQAVISEYVDNLEKLKDVLGRAMDSLGKRRDRLKKDLEHLNSARAWVETFRATNPT